MRNYYYEVGSWNVICDSCGKKIKSKHAKHRWDGFLVCDGCFEHRHPQDFVRTKPERNQVPFSRPRPTDVFVDVPYLTGKYVLDDYVDIDYIEEDDL